MRDGWHRAAVLASGDFVGPGAATDKAAVRFSGATGKLGQNSALIIADATGALSRTGGGGIPVQGTNTNDNAAAGDKGEYVSSVIASGSPVSLTSNVNANLTSIPLTAGDWDVNLTANFQGAGTTNVSFVFSSISLVSATYDLTNGRAFAVFMNGAVPFGSTSFITAPVGPLRFSLAAPATLYGTVYGSFTVNVLSAFGILRARRPY